MAASTLSVSKISKLKFMRRFFFCSFLALILAGISHAQSQTDFLRELSKFRIVVDELPESLEGKGLRRASILEKIEFSCRVAGLQVSDTADDVLHATVEGVAATAGPRNLGYFFTVRMALSQHVQGIRDKKIAPAITWNAHDFGVSPDERTLAEDVLKAVQSQSEIFVNDLLALRN